MNRQRALALVVAGASALAGAASEETVERHGVAIERPAPIPNPGALDASILADYRARRGALDRALSDASTSRAELGRACGALGMWLQVYRYFERAELAYACAEALAPDDARWPYHRAALHLRAGSVDRARAAFERTLVLEEDYLPALVRLADLEVKAGRPEVAERLLARVLAADADNPLALVLFGRIAVSARRYEQARDLLVRALARDPIAPEAHYLLVRVYRALGDEAAVRRHLEASRIQRRASRWAGLSDPLRAELERVGTGAAAEMERGRDALTAGRTQEAVAFYRRAVEASPDDMTARINLGGALQRAGDLEGAAAVFDEVVRIHPGAPPDPELAIAHFNRGVVLEMLGRGDEAEAAYRESLVSDPQQLAANRELGRLLVREGRADQALPHLETAIARDPANPGLRFDRVVALVALERYARAADRVEADLVMLPGQQGLMLVLARLRAGAPDDAVRDGERALELAERITPRTALVSVETLAMALAASGRFDEAVAWQRAALDAVRAQGLASMEPRVAARLARYERGEPSREVWRPEEAAAVGVAVPPPPLEVLEP